MRRNICLIILAIDLLLFAGVFYYSAKATELRDRNEAVAAEITELQTKTEEAGKENAGLRDVLKEKEEENIPYREIYDLWERQSEKVRKYLP